MTDRKHRTRLPLTSRVWFFPTLIMLLPLVSRACMNTVRDKPDRRPASPEKICLDRYDECIDACPVDGGSTPESGSPTAAEACARLCYEQYQICLLNPPATSTNTGDGYNGPTCEPDTSYCDYDDYDYDDSSSDWSCDSSDSSDDDWDCSADNSDDEGDSGDGDWGEDWGEQSPAGGDGIEAPLDLPRPCCRRSGQADDRRRHQRRAPAPTSTSARA